MTLPVRLRRRRRRRRVPAVNMFTSPLIILVSSPSKLKLQTHQVI